MAKITFDLTEFREKINKLRTNSKESEKILKKIITEYHKDVDLRFRYSRDPQGNKWEKLSNDYGEKEYLRGRTNPRILRRKGNLLNSINPYISKHSAGLRTNEKYAKIHQFGDKKRNIPQRRFFGFNYKQKIKFRKMILIYMLDKQKLF